MASHALKTSTLTALALVMFMAVPERPASGAEGSVYDICADLDWLTEATEDAADQSILRTREALAAAEEGVFDLAEELFELSQIKSAEAETLTQITAICLERE